MEGVAGLSGHAHLIGLGVLAHKGLIIGGEGGGVVVDVQHADVDGHPADLLRVVCNRAAGSGAATAGGGGERGLTELGGHDRQVVPGVFLAVQLAQHVHGAVPRVDVEHSVHVGAPVDGVPAGERQGHQEQVATVFDLTLDQRNSDLTNRQQVFDVGVPDQSLTKHMNQLALILFHL